MKINEIIVESVYDWVTKLGQTGKQAGWSAGGAAKFYGGLQAASAKAKAAQPTTQTPQQSQFLQQFQIVDTDPITVQWKNQQFQRNKTTGQWVNFPAGKPVSQQMVDALDRVSPPPATPAGAGGFTYPWQKDIKYTVNPPGGKK